MRHCKYKIVTTFIDPLTRGERIEAYHRLKTLHSMNKQWLRVAKNKETSDLADYLKGALRGHRQRVRESQPSTLKSLVRDKFKCDMTGNSLAAALRNIRLDLKDHRARLKYIDDNSSVHHAPGYWFQRQLRVAYGPKEPRTDDKYIGIEIECIVENSVNLERILIPYRKYISIGGDGSINTDEFCVTDENGDEIDGEYTHEGKEVRILVKESELNEVVTGVCRLLNENDVLVNASCGLHVHFDMRDTDEEKRMSIYSKLYHSIPLLLSVVPETRRKNPYCKVNTSNEPSYSGGSRYKIINTLAFREHSTFEIRLFNGTTSSEKILNWIELLQSIMQGETVLRCPTTFKHARKYWKFSDKVLRWLESRQAKFNTAQFGGHEVDREQPDIVSALQNVSMPEGQVFRSNVLIQEVA